MVRTCIVSWCTSRTKDNVSFHVFPRDQKMRQLWLDSFMENDPAAQLPHDLTWTNVCGRHFSPSDFLPISSNPNNGCRLKHGAIPSMFNQHELISNNTDDIHIFNPSEDDSSSNASDQRRLSKSSASTDNSTVDRQIRKLTEGHFLSDFNPETSSREQRKMTRKYYAPAPVKRYVYDERGRFATTGDDVCDCLDDACPGCHFPCPTCKNTKCGSQCRVNRRWTYELIEHDGKDVVITNKRATDVNSK